MASAHLIEDLQFEVELPPSARLGEDQERLNSFAQGAALRIIDEVFDEAAAGGAELRLERLEIDLGAVDSTAMEAQWESRLRERLQQALADCRAGRSNARAAPAARPSVGRQAAQLEALMHFLQRGRLPWHDAGDGDPVALAWAVLRHGRAELLDRLRRDASSGRLVRRMVQQLPADWLALLVEGIEPGAEPGSAGAQTLAQLQAQALASRPAPAELEGLLLAALAPPGRQQAAESSQAAEPTLAALRARLEAALGADAAASDGPALAEVWRDLLQRDRQWLERTLLQRGRSAAVRRRIASRWPEAVLVEMIALWLSREDCAAIVAALAGAAAPLADQADQATARRRRLWESSLRQLWVGPQPFELAAALAAPGDEGKVDLSTLLQRLARSQPAAARVTLLRLASEAPQQLAQRATEAMLVQWLTWWLPSGTAQGLGAFVCRPTASDIAAAGVAADTAQRREVCLRVLAAAGPRPGNEQTLTATLLQALAPQLSPSAASLALRAHVDGAPDAALQVWLEGLALAPGHAAQARGAGVPRDANASRLGSESRSEAESGSSARRAPVAGEAPDSLRRARLEATLSGGSAATLAEDWAALLRNDRPGLTFLMRSGAARAPVRRWLAGEFSASMWRELLGLLAGPSVAATSAEVLRLLAAAVAAAAAQPLSVIEAELREHALAALQWAPAADAAVLIAPLLRQAAWRAGMRLPALARAAASGLSSDPRPDLAPLSRLDLKPDALATARQLLAAWASEDATAPEPNGLTAPGPEGATAPGLKGATALELDGAWPERAAVAAALSDSALKRQLQALSRLDPSGARAALKRLAGGAPERRRLAALATQPMLEQWLGWWLSAPSARLLSSLICGRLPAGWADAGGPPVDPALRREWCLQVLVAAPAAAIEPQAMAAALWRLLAAHQGRSPSEALQALEQGLAPDVHGAAGDVPKGQRQSAVAARPRPWAGAARERQRRGWLRLLKSTPDVAEVAGAPSPHLDRPLAEPEVPLLQSPAPNDPELSLRRVRLASALGGGRLDTATAAILGDDWDTLLRHDAAGLRQLLLALCASARTRRSLSAGLAPARWQRLLDLFFGPSQGLRLARAVESLAEAASGLGRAGSSGDLGLALRERLVATLLWQPAADPQTLLSDLLQQAAAIAELTPQALAQAAALALGLASDGEAGPGFASVAGLETGSGTEPESSSEVRAESGGGVGPESAVPSLPSRPSSPSLLAPSADTSDAMPRLLRYLRDTSALDAATTTELRAALLGLTEQPHHPARRELALALEAAPAAPRLLDLLQGADLHAVLRWLRPADAVELGPLLRELGAAGAVASQAVATPAAAAEDAMASAGEAAAAILAKVAAVAQRGDRLLIRELFEEGRLLDPSGLALRWAEAMTAPLPAGSRQAWKQALVMELERRGAAEAEGESAAGLFPSLTPDSTPVSTPASIPRTAGRLASRLTRLLAQPIDDSRPSPPSTAAPSAADPAAGHEAAFDAAPDGAIYIANAGLVLAAPYLPRLFQMLGLIVEGAFVDGQATERAVLLCQYVATGATEAPESLLVLNKLLCGVPLQTPVPRDVGLGEAERSAADGMLQAMIEHWRALGQTSVAGLRESFLQRTGRLEHQDEAWQLQVEPRAFDMLLDRLPWGYATIKFSWMPEVLHVDWR